MPIHPALARELRQSKRLQKFFDSLPESSRHQIDHEVREANPRKSAVRAFPEPISENPFYQCHQW
jgi:hypothetical protein